MAVFGLLRALFPANYSMALVGTIGIAIGQPFLLNAFTKLAAIWFPQKQRATITGIIFLAMFVGIGLGEVLSPSLVKAFQFQGMQMIYGIVTGGCLRPVLPALHEIRTPDACQPSRRGMSAPWSSTD